MALCKVESKLDPTAIHHDDGATDSLGICQIKIATAKMMGFNGSEEDLMDPETNIYYAAKYLSHQIFRYNGSVYKGIVSYNTGSVKNLIQTEYADKVIVEWRTSK
jgi:soluble lytic murein transglycosylase-like protein